jgi:hypothetical protein
VPWLQLLKWLNTQDADTVSAWTCPLLTPAQVTGYKITSFTKMTRFDKVVQLVEDTLKKADAKQYFDGPTLRTLRRACALYERADVYTKVKDTLK